MKVSEADIQHQIWVAYDVDAERGFLSKTDPLERLPDEFSPLEEIALALPKLLAAGALRQEIKKLPVIENVPQGIRTQRLVALRIMHLAQGYIWETWRTKPETTLPRAIAIPTFRIAKALGMRPILSYAPYVLWNWRRIDPSKPIELGNLALIQNFLGGLDEEWFILTHVEIERHAGAAVVAAYLAQIYAERGDREGVTRKLQDCTLAMERVLKTLDRMMECCDPYVYYNRVRPYIHGWKNHPALPEGIIYEGVKELGGKPHKERGQTGAESSVIPSLDAAVGIIHKTDGEFHEYLMDLRNYMPPKHKAFIQTLEERPSIRNFVLNHSNDKELVSELDLLIHCIERFRNIHRGYAITYINKQAEKSPYNPTAYGTGGTPFVPYLTEHLEDTKNALISKPNQEGENPS